MRPRSTSTPSKPVRPFLLGGLLAGLAACGQAPGSDTVREADVTAANAPLNIVKVQVRGRVIDPAEALASAEKEAIAAKLAALEARSGQRVVVVAVSPGTGESMEQIGWAVSGDQAKGPVMMLVDPRRDTVRLEGPISPQRRARIAGAMQGALKADKVADAILAGIGVLEQPGT